MVPKFVSTICSSYFAARSSAFSTGKRRMMQAASAVIGAALCGTLAQAQTPAPILLPNTVTTVAGGTQGSAGNTGFTVGSPCSSGSPYTATDVFGDGCPATMAVFGPDMMDGIHVDGQGNLFIVDYQNNWTGGAVQMFRRVDAKTGIITLVMGQATVCATATATTAGAQDGNGDGCLIASGKVQKDRGYGMDPYGNFYTGSYTTGYVRILCNAVSPLCPIAAGVTQTYANAQKQVGYSYRIAGCVPQGPKAAATSATAASTTAGSAGDGYFASAFWNLPGDLAAWGPSNASFNGPSSVTGTNGTCGTNTGGLNGSRGVTADQYGNVYIHDGTDLRVRVVVGPPSYNGVTNPLPAVIQLNPTYSSVTAAQMYGRIYPIVGGFTATTKAGSCPAGAVGGITGVAVDTYGNACPWFNTTVSNANPTGLTMDSTIEGGSPAANLVIADPNNANIRVLYMGPTVAVGAITSSAYPMANAILLNNNPAAAPLSQVTHGYVYLLAGDGGGTSLSATTGAPVLGSSATIAIGGGRIAAGPNGNLYISSGSGTASAVFFYDVAAGSIRELLVSTGGATYASVVMPGIGTYTNNTYCPTFGQGDGTAAFNSPDTYPDAVLSTGVCFLAQGTGSSTQGIAVDFNNNLYLTDDETDSAGYGRSRIRKVLAGQLLPTTMGTPTTEVLRVHGPVGTIAGATAIAAFTVNGSSSEFNVATPSCGTTAYADNTVDCLATISFNPAAPGERTASLELTPAGLSTVANVAIGGMSSGTALVTDPAAPILPITSNLVGSSAVPVGAAVDSNGDVFTMDTAAGKFVEISGGATTLLPGTLPSGPAQLALDLAGNVYAAGSGASTLTLLTLNGTTYTASTVSIPGVATPEAVAVDAAGSLYVADKKTASVYKVTAAALPTSGLENSTPPASIASSLGSPTSLAVDSLGNVFIGDSGLGAILRVDAVSGNLTELIANIHPVSVAVDAAGDVYYQDSVAQAIMEIPSSSISSGVAGSTTVTVLGSLKTPSGLAVAGNGNVYSADSGAGTLKMIARDAYTFNFGIGSGGSPTLTGAITNAGNLAATGTGAGNTTNLVVAGAGANACAFKSGVLGATAAGSACSFTASFVGLGTGAISDVVSFLPAASTVGSLSLSATLNALSGTTTSLATLPATVLPGASITLTATVASTSPQGGITVTFLNGSTVLATGTTNASGVATYTFPAGALGTVYVFKASFAGVALLGASSSSPQTVTVALTPNTLSLSLSTTLTYPGQPVTFTATQNPAAAGQTITFLNGTAMLGSGTINSSGVATYVFTPTVGGIYTVTANYTSDAKVYASSTSATQLLTITSGAFSFGVNPTAIAITHGLSAQIALNLTALGGFSGQVTLSCSSPVVYVTCAVPFQSTAVSVELPSATITVAPTTTGELKIADGRTLWATLAPLGLLALAFGSRKRLPRVVLVALFALLAGAASVCISGCSHSSSGAASGPAPTGSPTITFTVAGGGTTITAPLVVTID